MRAIVRLRGKRPIEAGGSMPTANVGGRFLAGVECSRRWRRNQTCLLVRRRSRTRTDGRRHGMNGKAMAENPSGRESVRLRLAEYASNQLAGSTYAREHRFQPVSKVFLGCHEPQETPCFVV